MSPHGLRVTAAVQQARAGGNALVALETSVLAQGLPIPANREAAERMTGAVRRGGAVPVLMAVVDGVPSAGLNDDELERFLARDGVDKVTTRDLAAAIVEGRSGATTVAGTLALMRLAEIDVFATGGIGGVHRDAPFDESADLVELARTPAVVVCAGAKSILDLPATVERLETLGVPVIGYRTREFPAFYVRSSGLSVTTTADEPARIAQLVRAHRSLGRREAILVVQPVPETDALPHDLVEAATATGLAEAKRAQVRGAGTTPFLLAALNRETGGRALRANLALLESNAHLAAQIAVALTREAE